MTAYDRDCGCRVHNPPAVWPQRDWLCPYHEGQLDGYDMGSGLLDFVGSLAVEDYRGPMPFHVREARRLLGHPTHQEGLL